MSSAYGEEANLVTRLGKLVFVFGRCCYGDRPSTERHADAESDDVVWSEYRTERLLLCDDRSGGGGCCLRRPAERRHEPRVGHGGAARDLPRHPLDDDVAEAGARCTAGIEPTNAAPLVPGTCTDFAEPSLVTKPHCEPGGSVINVVYCMFRDIFERIFQRC